MYPYNDLPGDNSNQTGSYPPPPPYTYPYPDSYQNQRSYYPQQSQMPRRGSEVWRVIGWILLIWFVGALLIGHHGFLWLLIVLGAIYFFSRRNRFDGYRRWHHYGKMHYYPHSRPQASNYSYYPPQEQPGYYYPPQPTNSGSGWPTPDPSSETQPKI